MHIRQYLFGVCALLMACNSADQKTLDKERDPLYTNRDTSVSPADDFFSYANGGWIKATPIPESESGWGIGRLVQEDIYHRLKIINEKAIAENAANGTISQKIADFWLTGMDTISINKNGLAPLKEDLNEIDAAGDIKALTKVAGKLSAKGTSSLFGAYIGQDDMNSEKMMVHLYQGGLGLPNRDYYFETDAKTIAVRNAYKKYLTTTLEQLGFDEPGAAMAALQVYDLEKKLADSSRTLSALRDPYTNYNKLSYQQLRALSPNMDWDGWMAANAIRGIDSILVGQPEFFKALNKELAATPLPVWKNYLKINHVSDMASYLDTATYNNRFNYLSTITGAKTPRDRWKRVLDAEENAMGEALGQLFVKEYFDETAKKRYENMVEAVRDAFKERIAKLTWMSDSTKQLAYKKLASIKKKVGYPDKWKDFSELTIDRTSFVGNVMRANQWWTKYYGDKLGKPVDRTEWEMTPQTYNAYYNPSNNEIVLPAGIFAIPGRMDAELDDAMVYGYAGASTIGHEITHGFDDEGRQFDANGNLKDWWTSNDAEEFKQRAAFIIHQYNEFIPVDTLHVNGEATQGENIADLGGLLIGLDAFKKTETYKNGKAINGLTPLQRFFLGYAYGWLYQYRPENLANRVRTDVHSPARERVNGPMVNIPEFYEAFGIQPGDKMYRPDSLRVHIW